MISQKKNTFAKRSLLRRDARERIRCIELKTDGSPCMNENQSIQRASMTSHSSKYHNGNKFKFEIFKQQSIFSFLGKKKINFLIFFLCFQKIFNTFFCLQKHHFFCFFCIFFVFFFIVLFLCY